MNDYKLAQELIRKNERWQKNILAGEPRPGHPEGSVSGHIDELLTNLDVLDAAGHLQTEDRERLELLILVHDAFKAESAHGVPIDHPTSHASLAAAFLAEFIDDAELLEMVRRHDEPFALYRRVSAGKAVDQQRMQRLLASINDWRLFLLFQIVDNVTEGKDAAPLRWFFSEARKAGITEPSEAAIDCWHESAGACVVITVEVVQGEPAETPPEKADGPVCGAEFWLESGYRCVRQAGHDGPHRSELR